MRWLVRFIDQFRRPQITVAQYGEVVLINGRPYALRPDGLHQLRIHRKDII